MSQVSQFMCDGPTCLETVEDAIDEDDLTAEGWFVMSFMCDDDEQTAHLCSAACVVAWAQGEADAA